VNLSIWLQHVIMFGLLKIDKVNRSRIPLGPVLNYSKRPNSIVADQSILIFVLDIIAFDVKKIKLSCSKETAFL
jgi:hypothetical protein